MALENAVKRVVTDFDYSADDVRRGVKEFLREMNEGLQKSGTELSQIPTYVTSVPNGTEKGLYLAVDLGGTNFRVLSIQLNGDTTFKPTPEKVAIPRELMVASTSKELFSFLAKQIEKFFQKHHSEEYLGHMERRKNNGDAVSHDEKIYSLGFTFSFPINQHGINRGTLLRWTKGFGIQETVGQDVCKLLQDEIDALGLPIKVAALVNDTVGTLMARSYTSPGKSTTLLGAIFGTGTNGAYVEKLDRIKKLASSNSSGDYDSSTGEMIVNTEWGSFDNNLHVLPNTLYDMALDAESINPGIQMFEKRVSGMFLGEILRRVLLSLVEDPGVPLFQDNNSASNDLHTTTDIASDSALYSQWGLDTSFLSTAHGDQTSDLSLTRLALSKDLGVNSASFEDAQAVKLIASAIGKRAARLSAVALGAVVISSGRLRAQSTTQKTQQLDGAIQSHINGDGDDVDIGVDGSLVEFYPHFKDYIREAFREIPDIGEKGERRIRIGIAKDGSGVGAALIAQAAEKAGFPAPS